MKTGEGLCLLIKLTPGGDFIDYEKETKIYSISGSAACCLHYRYLSVL